MRAGRDAAPAGVRKRTSRARAATGLRSRALRPAARSWLTMRAVEAPSEARPVAVEDAANGAPGGALSLKSESDAPRKRVRAALAKPPRDAIASIPCFPALRSPKGALTCRAEARRAKAGGVRPTRGRQEYGRRSVSFFLIPPLQGEGRPPKRQRRREGWGILRKITPHPARASRSPPSPASGGATVFRVKRFAMAVCPAQWR